MEPATPAECLRLTKLAFELSEQIGNLVVLRGLARLSHTRAGVTPGPLPEARPKPYWDPSQRWFTIPVVPRHQVMLDKLARAGEILSAAGSIITTAPRAPSSW